MPGIQLGILKDLYACIKPNCILATFSVWFLWLVSHSGRVQTMIRLLVPVLAIQQPAEGCGTDFHTELPVSLSDLAELNKLVLATSPVPPCEETEAAGNVICLALRPFHQSTRFNTIRSKPRAVF